MECVAEARGFLDFVLYFVGTAVTFWLCGKIDKLHKYNDIPESKVIKILRIAAKEGRS